MGSTVHKIHSKCPFYVSISGRSLIFICFYGLCFIDNHIMDCVVGGGDAVNIIIHSWFNSCNNITLTSVICHIIINKYFCFVNYILVKIALYANDAINVMSAGEAVGFI